MPNIDNLLKDLCYEHWDCDDSCLQKKVNHEAKTAILNTILNCLPKPGTYKNDTQLEEVTRINTENQFLREIEQAMRKTFE